MARHHGPLMALPAGWTTRAYDLPETAAGPLDRAAGTCRKCGRAVSRSPVSGWWWAYDGQPAGFCDHQPVRVTQAPRPVPVPGQVGFSHRQGVDIGDAEIVSIGDDWVKVTRHLSAVDAGAEVLGLDWHARRVTGQVPAQPETLDGVPCRSCEAMSSLVLVERAQPDRAEGPPPWCRCPDCGDEMTRAELTAWCDQYAAWVKGAGILTCRRCDMRPDLDAHPGCCWASCTCCGGRGGRAAA